ncbi:MFS general substrate transporter [Hymenopellis radicata]|nr:MFS general substrate transporter [Hymenopellis radicata]
MSAGMRLTTLVTAICVSLGAGTNYVYSAYSPQLGARLGINHTKLNFIALAGNVGVYSSGPIWGRLIDVRGPRIAMAGAFFLLLIGYGGMKHMYDTGDGASTITFVLLLVFGYMTGSGGNAGLSGAVNATAKSFPEALRASATSLVLSGFGLSAFFFSSISRILFPGDTSSFLLVLSLGTALPMIAGFFFVRAVPPVEHDSAESNGQGDVAYGRTSDVEAPPVVVGDGSRTPLLREHPNSPLGHGHVRSPTTPAIEYIPEALAAVELSPTRSEPSRSIARSLSRARSAKERSVLRPGLIEPNIYGRALWCTAEFWLLFVILALLSGTGLMYINNVGSMAQALYSAPSTTEKTIGYESYQATQVSAISLTNCLGRILIGLLSDFMSRPASSPAFCSFRPLPRSAMLVVVSSLLLLSQLVAISISSVENLWAASTLLGLSYGSIFGIYPTMCIEYFGLAHFSENWGFISLAPMVGGNVFSVAFGRNLDAHSDSASAPALTAPASAGNECTLGRACYVDTLYLTTVGCLVALGMSVYLSWRDRRRTEGAEYEPVDVQSDEESEEED